MRAILFILILAIVALIVLVATGFVNFNQTRPAKVPEISANREGVSAAGGQTPAFDVETGTVSVGTTQANVAVPVPKVSVNPANDAAPAPATTNNVQ